MKIIYIAGPYNARNSWLLQRNIKEASWMAAFYWCKGYAVICPHMNSAFFDGLLEDSVFLKGYITLLSKCDEIAMHPCWRISPGSVKEHAYAELNDITCRYPNMEDIKDFLNV